ncbi:alpha/beta-hydrolase [Eremomyces bilateralis CBS 781.70]|uniref:Alpha/beta-hydrolase n=1 Tax=Eremomyces bilateralis CBS 781.70 TaxID=1392243 RepID=A0A6G1GF74_9PEZI|nr:alpha/beta-hydrolase [Eremomyces bilateralis CBS 781.70]KAF1816510.1 alpha/beta-hydrolase [Eremomyces bilateralis CBS 781.70]
MTTSSTPLPPWPLPPTITSLSLPIPPTPLTIHLLSSTPSSTPTTTTKHPLILLLHGYPELSFSWRHILPRLSAAGYHVVAPDLRGYGRTTGWDVADLSGFALTNLVRDLVCLVGALGYEEVACVVGHDFGAVAAAAFAGIRGDVVRSVVLMSHPAKGWGPVVRTAGEATKKEAVLEELARLERPRKHYTWANSTAQAGEEWARPAQGMAAFLRGYFHLKSADWAGNKPGPLAGWTAGELAKMPEYYVMPLDLTMAETVARNMAGEDEGATRRWLAEEELAVYVAEWTRTGFQGGLNWYRAGTDRSLAIADDMALFAGRKIEVPAVFLSGRRDWGNYQEPGALEGMGGFCTDFRGVRLIEGAGHWPAQEQPEKVTEGILGFLKEVHGAK